MRGGFGTYDAVQAGDRRAGATRVATVAGAPVTTSAPATRDPWRAWLVVSRAAVRYAAMAVLGGPRVLEQ